MIGGEGNDQGEDSLNNEASLKKQEAALKKRNSKKI
jgi:hypothetical protein